MLFVAVYVLVYVDDTLFISNEATLKNTVKTNISSLFWMKELGPAARC